MLNSKLYEDDEENFELCLDDMEDENMQGDEDTSIEEEDEEDEL